MKDLKMSSWVNQSVERVTGLISEITKPYKAIIHQKHFVELRNIIMDAGKDFILDMEKVEEERDFLKKECILLNRMNVVAEADKSKFQVELRNSQKECQELKKLGFRRNDRMVYDLNGKIDKMKDQILEKDDMIRSFRQKKEFSEKKIADMEKELKDLKDQKLASDGIFEEMRLKEREASRAMEELKHKYLESSENTKMLRCEMWSAELYKTRNDEFIKMQRKLFESDQTIEELLSRNLKACDVMEGLNKRILAFEAEKTRFEEIIEEMKRRKLKDDQTVNELRSRNSEAHDAIEGLKKDSEVEKTRFERIIEAMKLKADQTVNELRSCNLKERDTIERFKKDFELVKKEFEETIEEMNRKQVKADETVKKLRKRNSETHDDIERLKKCIVAFEVEKKSFEEIIEEMKLKGLKADQTVNDLRNCKLEAHYIIEGLKKRIVDFEDEKGRSDQIILEMKRKQIDADQALDNFTRENLEAIDDLKCVIVKKSMETKGAKDANASFCEGEKQNLESGSSVSIERASNVVQQIEVVEIIDSGDEAIPVESTFNCAEEKIFSVPSPGQSGLLVDFFPRRKRSPRANRDDSSRPRKKQVPVPAHERDVSVTVDMPENPNSGLPRTTSLSNSKPVTVRGSQSPLIISNSSSNEDSSDSDDDSCSDSHMEEMIRSLEREKHRKT